MYETSILDAQPRLMGKRPFIILAVMLLLGAVLPIFDYGHNWSGMPTLSLHFINFEILGESGRSAPLMVKLLFLYPLLAGGVLCVVAALLTGAARAAMTLALGVIPLIICVSNDTLREAVTMLFARRADIAALLFLAALGWWGLITGSLVLRYQRINRVGAIIAAIGGGLFAIYLFFPIILPNGSVVMPIQLAIRELAAEGAPVVVKLNALLNTVAIFLLLTAAAFSITYAFSKRIENCRTQFIFRLVEWALAVMVAQFMNGIYASAGNAPRSGDGVLIATSIFIKFLAWVGGLLMLLPFGLADLILVIASARPPRGLDVLPSQPDPSRLAPTQPVNWSQFQTTNSSSTPSPPIA